MATNPSSITHAAWGVTRVTLGDPYTGCVCIDCDMTIEAQHQNEQDQNGAVVGDTIYDQRKTYTLTVQVPKGLSHPTPGTMITIDGEACELISVSEIQSNRDYQKVRLVLEHWPNLAAAGITDLTSTASA